MRSPEDPVDHARTTRPHAGESMKDSKNMPALILLGVALVCFVSGLAAFGAGHPDFGTGLGVIAVSVFAVSMLWFAVEHRRVRRIEQRWYATHPDAEPRDGSS